MIIKSIELKPGDCLLYAPLGFFGKIISLKTWHEVGHCECYVGNEQSVASRDGKGVNLYPFRDTELIWILRPPINSFNLKLAYDWFETVKGQKYDWYGLLRFAWKAEHKNIGNNNKMFCSEFLARFYNRGGWDLFYGEDCDAVPPCLFLRAGFTERWCVK